MIFRVMRCFCRKRKEYLELLKNDLCLYYGYNEFLMSKILQMFPLAEVCLSLKLENTV